MGDSLAKKGDVGNQIKLSSPFHYFKLGGNSQISSNHFCQLANGGGFGTGKIEQPWSTKMNQVEDDPDGIRDMAERDSQATIALIIWGPAVDAD